MAVLRMFASAREAAGTGRVEVDGRTVGDVLDQARVRFGQSFAAVLDSARIWVDGEPATHTDPVDERSEVAVLPPVSGGS